MINNYISAIGITLLLFSCKTNNIDKDDIIEIRPFIKKDYFKYINKSNYYIDNDSFKPILYSNVKPLEENKKIPKKIFGRGSYWQSSKEYFQKELKGKSISYLEKNNHLIFRNFYYDYTFNTKKTINTPTNVYELEKYLNTKKIHYKILKLQKKYSTDIVDVEIQNKLYKIILNNTLCESYLFYNKNDTINFDAYRNMIINFYW